MSVKCVSAWPLSSFNAQPTSQKIILTFFRSNDDTSYETFYTFPMGRKFLYRLFLALQ